MSWVFLALFAPFLSALANIVDKFLLGKRMVNCFALLPVAGFFALLFGVGSFLFVSFDGVPISKLAIAFGLGLVGSFLYMLYYFVLSSEEVSRVISIWYVQPVFVLLFALLFLGEMFPLFKIGGILFCVGGAIALGIDKLPKGFAFRKGFWWLMLNCVISALVSVGLKFSLEGVGYWQIFSAQSFGLFVGLSSTIFMPSVRKHLGHVLKNVHILGVSEVLAFTAKLVLLAAFALAPVSLVSALSSVQPLFVLGLSLFLSIFIPSILKEDWSRSVVLKKSVSVAAIFVGAVIVAV
jgi:uncharacterized membrane protein